MATATRLFGRVVLDISEDEAKDLTRVLSHVKTESVYDTFDIYSALTDGEDIPSMLRYLEDRRTVGLVLSQSAGSTLVTFVKKD